MTWNEFKIVVDKQLAELHQDGDVHIWYIDISFPDKPDLITVGVDDVLGVSVSYPPDRYVNVPSYCFRILEEYQ